MKRKDFFNINAKLWDKNISINTITKIKDLIFPLLDLKADDNVIDIGCGTGILVPFFKQYIDNCQITELDFSKEMIGIAKEKYGQTITYINSSAENIPVNDKSFSKAVIFNSFPHFEDKQKVLSETFRILKNNAIILLAHSDSKDTINKRHKRVGGIIGEDLFETNKKMELMFKKVGFRNIEIIDTNEIFYIKAIKREE